MKVPHAFAISMGRAWAARVRELRIERKHLNDAALKRAKPVFLARPLGEPGR